MTFTNQRAGEPSFGCLSRLNITQIYQSNMWFPVNFLSRASSIDFSDKKYTWKLGIDGHRNRGLQDIPKNSLWNPQNDSFETKSAVHLILTYRRLICLTYFDGVPPNSQINPYGFQQRSLISYEISHIYDIPPSKYLNFSPHFFAHQVSIAQMPPASQCPRPWQTAISPADQKSGTGHGSPGEKWWKGGKSHGNMVKM